MAVVGRKQVTHGEYLVQLSVVLPLGWNGRCGIPTYDYRNRAHAAHKSVCCMFPHLASHTRPLRSAVTGDRPSKRLMRWNKHGLTRSSSDAICVVIFASVGRGSYASVLIQCELNIEERNHYTIYERCQGQL